MLSKITGKVYISTLDAGQPPKSIQHQLKTALTRPWILLFKEPIVFLISLYHSIIYGTLYMCFAAFPIVFQIGRGWSPGIGGLAFIGSAVGVLFATLMSIFENNRYSRLLASQKGLIDPEARLPMGLLGSIFIPVGLFWFAWTTFPTVHWVVPIMGTSFFSFGLVSVFLSLTNYLIDSCKFIQSIRNKMDPDVHFYQMSFSRLRCWPPIQFCVPYLVLLSHCSLGKCITSSGINGLVPSQLS
jgi:hypothetical protein